MTRTVADVVAELERNAARLEADARGHARMHAPSEYADGVNLTHLSVASALAALLPLLPALDELAKYRTVGVCVTEADFDQHLANGGAVGRVRAAYRAALVGLGVTRPDAE